MQFNKAIKIENGFRIRMYVLWEFLFSTYLGAATWGALALNLVPGTNAGRSIHSLGVFHTGAFY